MLEEYLSKQDQKQGPELAYQMTWPQTLASI